MSTKLLTLVRKVRVDASLVLEGGTKRQVTAPARKGVLNVLCGHANDDGYCRVSQTKLAQETGYSVNTIWRVLTSLEADGFIERGHRYGKLGYRVADEIQVLLPPGALPTPPGGVALEAPLRSVKSPALLGPGEEVLDMNYVDLRETEGASDLAPENPRPRPTKPKAKRRPDQMNPVGLAQYFAAKTRSHQWGHPNATPIKVLAGTFRRWRDDDGVTYREIAIAIDLFFDQLPPGLEAPAGRLFIKQGFDWISKAKGDIYQQDLPKMKAASRALHQELHQLHAQWLAAHPEADQDEQDRRYSEIWMDLKTDPKYAIAYA